MRYFVVILVLLGMLTSCSFSQAGTISMTVKWTAPGDDGDVGRASRYELRYAEGTAFDWEAALVVPDSLMPVPSAAGSADSVTLSGVFKSNSVYCFALKTADEVPNWSVMSNVACVETPDVIPPDGVTITVQMTVIQ